MTRKASLLFAILLVFQSMAGGLGMAAPAKAEGTQDNVFAGDVLLTDENDKQLDVENINNGDSVRVHIGWSIESASVEAGDTYQTTVPDEVEILEEQEGMLDADRSEVGTHRASESGEVTVEFTDEIEEHQDAEGTIVVDGEYAAAFEDNDANDSANDDSNENNADEVDGDNERDAKSEGENETSDANNEENGADEEAGDGDLEEKEDNGKSGSKDEAIKEDKEEGKSSSSKAGLSNDEKHGFKLELNEILDLDDEAFEEQNPMDPHKEFKLRLDWELEDGHNYKAGDTETFDLPKGIKIEKDIEIELTDETGETVANAVVTPDKKVELTFTDFVETHSDVSGWMEIISTLDIEEVEEEDGEVIIDPIGEEGELRIPIEKSNKDKTIEKNGTPDGYNADEIDWEVTVNKNKTSLKDAKVTDVLPEGTEYKDGSLKVTKLRVDLDGNVLGDGEEVEVTPEVNEEGELTVPLGDTNDAYRVEYVTSVTDDEETNFKNNATITDEELDDVSAESTVTINRGEPLKKGAVKDYDPKTGIIEWYLEFNYNQKDLNDVTLADNWKPAGKVELVDGSLTFQEMTIDENGDATPNGDPVDPSEIGATENQIDDGFEVSGITTDKAYRVVYQTKVIDRELDGFRMENLASFEDNESGEGYEIGQFVGQKSAGNVDYEAKTIEWTIKVNSDHRQMNDVIIEDTIGGGLTLIDDSIDMTIGGQEYKDFDLENGNPFKLTNIGDTDQEIIVTYETEFDADNVQNHIATNKANISWIPEDGSDRIYKDVEANTELNKETQDNSWKNGSYDPETKEITWEMIVNYRENEVKDLNIHDEPQQNQKIIKDSAVVKELNIAANGKITEGDPVSDVATIDEGANTLDVALGETDKAYKIVYKTSLKDLDDMKDEYTNEAKVQDGDEILSEIDAKVGVVKDSKYGDKSGYQDGKQVHWSIDVNVVQQKIKDLKLVDSISDNQEYLEDSIKVYDAKIDGDGKASKGEEVSTDEYELEIDQDSGEFTVEWKDEVERAFIVEYSTLFFAGHNEDVGNDYTITGDSIEEEGSDANGSDSVSISQLGSGGGEGTAGYLVIDKVDSTYNQDETKLEGAEFDLIDADTGNVLKSGITDENGQIDFGRLLFGDYTLKETKVPEGFVTPEEEQTIKIDKEYKSGDDKEAFEYTVENYEPVFAIELSKKDDEGNALEDAEFTLFDSQDKEIAKTTTDEDGKILFEDLKEAGTYYVQETKAPTGYVLDEAKHKVEVGEKEQKPVTIDVENDARGAVQLTKTDTDTDESLEGVEFALQKENDSGGYGTIKTFTTDEDGQIKTSNTLEAGNYQFVETEGLDGYRTNGTPVKFTVNVNSTENQEFTMENEQYKGAVKLVKQDSATGKELKGAEFKLVDADGEVVEENLKTNAQGEIIVEDLFLGDYQLIETKAPEGYEKDETPIDIELTEDNQVVEKTMTNNKITDIIVEKKWNNDGGDTRPVTINLLPTDETVELNEDNEWKATFEDLDVYDDSGEAIDYQVEELDVDGYNSVVTGDSSDGFIVTNTETISVSGEKLWKDDDYDERPDQITVELLAEGEKVSTEKVNADSDWKYKFTNLDKYDEDGEEIEYTIDEVEVEGYETTIDGFDIENVRVGTISVEGEKTWQDVNSTDRPDDITVELFREVDEEKDEDFSESKTVKPDNKGDWTYGFADLDEFNDEGVAYTYLVKEADVPEKYKSEVNGHDITNTRTGKTEVSGTKRWKDDTIEDRPDTIKVNLLRNDVVKETKEVTADDNWKYTFTELDKYNEEGQLHDYTVKEQDVEGYDSKVNDHDITNTRSEQKSIEVTKGWLDDDSEDRPESVIVYLNQNEELFDKIEVKADNDWTYEFTDLEAYDKDGQPYKYTIEEKAIDGYESTVDGFNITNLRVGETELAGEKTWLDDNSEARPEEITVKLLANGEETDQTVTVDADSNWEYKFAELDKYDDQGKEIKYSVDEEKVDGYEKSFDGNNITNLRVGKTEVTGEKVWEEVDERYRPDSITVQLLANGEKEDTIEVSEETDWSYAFTGLDKYDDQGKEIDYSIEELDIPRGYESELDGFDVVNTQKTTEVSGEKIWDEVNEEYRPEKVEVQLLANGEPEETKELTENNWEYEFTDLAKYDKDGEEITYTVEELDVPEGYDSEVDGFDITNTQKSTEVSGEKTWKEVDDRYRPDAIEVQLFADGQKETTLMASENTDWKYEFTDLAKYDQAGEEIEYTVEEINVPEGYESKVDGFDMSNTQKTTEIQGEKSWKEVDDQYRPEDVTIQLLANGNEETEVEVSEDTDWEYEFTNLAKYDKNGDKIDYTVEEVDVPKGYVSEVDGYTVTNTQKTTTVSGVKTWLDDGSEDRPEKITVQLKHGDDVVAVQEVTAEDDWKYSFSDLPKYNKDGKEINYIVDEKDIDGYEKSIEDNDITNVRVGTTDVDITKTWNDEKDSDRPKSIKVNILQNGEVYGGESYEVTDENHWKLTVEDLPKYDDQGVAYEYTVTEQDVPGYNSEVDGFDITNTRAETKDIEITKTWLDTEESEKRLESIEVELFRSVEDGDKESVDTYEVTGSIDEKSWSKTIKDLPAYDEDGKAYTYEIEEESVDGYETTINGFDITNLRVGTTSVEGEKIWEGDNESNRPDSITVDLLANGEKVDSVEVTAETDWIYAFTDLDAYDGDGARIEYTIEEKEVDGYETSIDGYDITNTFISEEKVDVEKDDSDKTNTPKDTEDKETPDNVGNDDGDVLPKTATDLYNFILAGFVLIAIGVGMYFIASRRRNI